MKILDAALEYLDMGFSIIPVRRDKKPYIPWAEYQKRHPTEKEVEGWFNKWPDANIAIVCGQISKVYCVDADGPAGIDWINNNLPTTSVYNVTAKGLHAIFKTNGTPIKNHVRLAPDVDIRGDGGYFVAPPSVHESGFEYKWQFVMNGWEDLTVYSMPQQTQKKGNLSLNLSSAKTAPINQPVEQGSRNQTLAQLCGKWFASGLDDQEVEVMARHWNENNSPPLGDSELKKTIWSINKTHQENHPEIVETSCDLEIEHESELAEIPSEIENPGGFLKATMDYIDQNSPASVPLYSLAASLSFLGHVIGQKLQTETGLRTNLYMISLGYSGSGKNSPISTLPQLLLSTKAPKTLGPTEFTSSTAILKWISQNPNTLMIVDEIGSVLKGLQNPNSVQADIPRMLTKLFSNTDRPEIKNYADGSSITVPWHHLSIYGASTPERFWESLTPGEVADGFLARVLIFESRHDAPMPKVHIKFRPSPELTEMVNRYLAIEVETDQNRGNFENVPIPKIIPRDQESQELFHAFSAKYHEKKNEYKSDTSGIASIYGRAAEHCAKIALIHAASMRGPAIKCVPAESVQWASVVMDYIIENTVKQVGENITDTDIGRWKNRIIKGIRDITNRNKMGASIRDLQRGCCAGLLSKDLKNILFSLAEAEKIGSESFRANNNKTVVRYFVAK